MGREESISICCLNKYIPHSCLKARGLTVHDRYACQRVHLHWLFLLDSGFSTNCFLILLILWGSGSQVGTWACWQLQMVMNAQSFYVWSIWNSFLHSYCLISGTNPHLYGLSTFRLIYINEAPPAASFSLLCLLKLSSRNKRLKYRPNIRIDLIPSLNSIV